MAPPRKLTLDLDGVEVEHAPPPTFQRQTMASGVERLLISVPIDRPGLLLHLAKYLPEPYFVLYVLHTPRGEGSSGRYQSGELSWITLEALLIQYQAYLAGDARHDIWVYSPDSGRTLIWDRHNLIFAEGHPLDDISAALLDLGFKDEAIEPIGPHYHHYRPEFDEYATDLLSEFDWHRTPLRPGDEQ